MEVVGTPCEGIRLDDNAVFQGTCPGWYNYEFSRGIKVVKDSMIVNKPGSTHSSIGKRYAIKIHERDFLGEPPICFAVNEIGKPGEAGKKFSVISTSDERIVYSSNINKQEDPKEIDEDFDTIYEGEVYD